MSTNLYMEAIQEAQELKAMAEQSAKNKIIEALTPKIQAMVEAQLLSEQVEDVEVEEVDGEDWEAMDAQLMTSRSLTCQWIHYYLLRN